MSILIQYAEHLGLSIWSNICPLKNKISSTIRRKVGGKRIPVNVIAAPKDNVSYHYETSV